MKKVRIIGIIFLIITILVLIINAFYISLPDVLVQDIFLQFYPAYPGRYTPSPEQAKTARNIMNCKTVTFSVKDYRNKGQWKELTLPGVEFIRRFLMHVPPKRFVRIRHYGLLCPRSFRYRKDVKMFVLIYFPEPQCLRYCCHAHLSEIA